MGLFDFAKKQFIDVIQWTEESDGVLAYRFPTIDKEIQSGAQLIVRDTQVALFVNEGEIADLFGPGTHTLTTENMPILTNLKNWDKGFESPFKSEVYFFSTREQVDQRWGTSTPIVFRDQELGAIQLRAHGTYTYKIKNPQIFYQKVSGTRDLYDRDELSGQIRSMILTHLAAFFGKGEVNFLQMAANQIHFSETLLAEINPAFESYGLKLEKFFVQSVSLPDALQEYLNKKTSMDMVGDLARYAQFESADAIRAAANNPGGGAGAGVGLGAGLAMGQQMMSQMGGGAGGAASKEDPIETINRLHGLMKSGVLSEEEFNAKKAELLKKV